MARKADIRYVPFPMEGAVLEPLGLDPAEAGVPQLRTALCSYGTALTLARRRLGKVFTRAEWNLMADVMNGALDLYDYAEMTPALRIVLVANVQDGHRIDGAGFNWFGAEDGGRKVAELCRKLTRLTSIEADAIGAAIREFWRRPDVDPTVEEWWLPRGDRERATSAAEK